MAPAVLEAVLLSHPAVAEAAVIACPDDEAGEIPWAFVVRREAVSAGDLITFVAQRVAPHEKIRRLETRSRSPGRARSCAGYLPREMHVTIPAGTAR